MDEAKQASTLSANRRSDGRAVPMIDAVFVILACQVLEQAGADAAAILADIGLGQEAVLQADRSIPFRQNVAVLEAAARHAGDPCFGLNLAAQLNSQNIGVLGYVATASATVADALANVQRYYHVLSDGAAFESRVESGQLVIEYRVLDPAAQHSRQNDDMSLMSILRLMQISTGKRPFADWVETPHSAPAQAPDYGRLFGAPLRFEAGRNAVVLPAGFLDLPFHSADDNLLSILKGHCQSLLKERDHSYRDLLDDPWAGPAERYLRDRKLRLSEIAYMPGYAGLSAFNQAFNRWTGCSPSEFRQQAA